MCNIVKSPCNNDSYRDNIEQSVNSYEESLNDIEQRRDDIEETMGSFKRRRFDIYLLIDGLQSKQSTYNKVNGRQ